MSETQKKKSITKLIIFVMFIAIVTSILTATTYTRYTTGQSGEGNAVVARWSFKTNGLGEEALTASILAVEHVAEKRIAPGTSGEFQVEIDATGTEVALEYNIEILNVKNKPENLKFYTDNTYTTEVEVETIEEQDIYSIKGEMTLEEIETTPTRIVSIYWKWEYETTGGDAVDTEDGKTANNMEFDVRVTGTQIGKRNYEIKYEANGGEGAPETQTKATGETITISQAEPTKDGYAFVGWATTSDATEKEYLPGDTYTADADITLYAVWTKITTITFTKTTSGNTTTIEGTIPAGATVSVTVGGVAGSQTTTGTGTSVYFNDSSKGGYGGGNSGTVTFETGTTSGTLKIVASGWYRDLVITRTSDGEPYTVVIE